MIVNNMKNYKYQLVIGIKRLLFRLFSVFPIKKNKIVFSNMRGRGYGDNPKYVYEYLKDTGEKLDFCWLVNDDSDFVPDGIRRIKYNTLCEIYEMSTAKIWVDNARKPLYTHKRKGQYYIQLWHGGDPGKRVERDTVVALPDAWIKTSIHDSKMADLMVADSEFCYSLFKNSFWYDGEIKKWGSPREDILVKTDKINRMRICKKLNIDPENSFVMYAPTFRDDGDLSVFNIDAERIINALEKRYGGKWTFLLRYHPITRQLQKDRKDQKNTENIVDCTDYPDMQELLSIVDFEISDYSGTIFEYAGLRRKPVIVFALDLDKYIDDRGFYYSISEWPFCLTQSNEQLVDAIINFDEEDYLNRINLFNSKFRWFVDGHSSERVGEHILAEIKGI